MTRKRLLGLGLATIAIAVSMSACGGGGARYEYFITAGWLGNTDAYTTPVLETLTGWNGAWSLQRGESADVALRVYVSPSGATPQAVWSYLQGNPALGVYFALRHTPTDAQPLNARRR